MKQSSTMSFLESLINIVVGLGIAMIANAIILPALGFAITFQDNAIIAAFMTVVSLCRSFALRRLFEALHIRRPLSPFMQAVIAERYRQQEADGWDHAHDNDHGKGTLARAGAAYLFGPNLHILTDYERDEKDVAVSGRLLWPWEIDWWKPQDFRRDLVRGCALGIAEGERFDRLKTKKHTP